jgi:HK97 family phage portal protein
MPNILERTGEAIKAARAAWGFGSGSTAQTGERTATFMATNAEGKPVNVTPGSGGGQSINYAARVGDFTKNNSVFTAMAWIRRNFPDARVAVQNIKDDELIPSHPMAMLLARPNPNYSFSTLGAGLSFSFVGDGNAYGLKRRDGYGQVVEVWYRPHWMLKPVRDPGSSNFIDAYIYKPDARTPAKRLPVSEVVHLRNGIDPENEMLGMSDLKRLLMSIYTEQECNRFMAATLTNLGMPGAIFTHKPPIIDEEEGERAPGLTKDQADSIKSSYRENFTGERVGGAMVLDGEFEVDFPQISIDTSFVEKAKDISQADIAAAIGIPPVVLGWHIGLKTATAKASHEDSRKQAYRECLMPMHRSMAEDFDIQLLPDFDDNKLVRTVWDYRHVATLADDTNATATRATRLYLGGLATRAEGRKIAGLTPREGTVDDVFYQGKGGGDDAGSDPNADPLNDTNNPDKRGGPIGPAGSKDNAS